jgi:hypothetical protein
MISLPIACFYTVTFKIEVELDEMFQILGQVRQQCDVINGPHIHSCSAMMLLTPTKFDL